MSKKMENKNLCPYRQQQVNGNKKMKCYLKSGPRQCIYKRIQDCPFLADSKASPMIYENIYNIFEKMDSSSVGSQKTYIPLEMSHD